MPIRVPVRRTVRLPHDIPIVVADVQNPYYRRVMPQNQRCTGVVVLFEFFEESDAGW